MVQTGHGAGAPALLRLPRLVVKQKLKLMELKNEYEVFDDSGRPVGKVTQVRQSPLAILTRLFSDLDAMLPVHLELTDAGGGVVLHMSKPWFRWSVRVSQPDGTPVGEITKQFRLGKARFGLSGPDGAQLGEVHAQNWRAKDFAVYDAAGQRAGQVTKKWAGMRELFTDADTYAVEVPPTTPEPLRSLAVASCLTIDTLMKQKDS